MGCFKYFIDMIFFYPHEIMRTITEAAWQQRE